MFDTVINYLDKFGPELLVIQFGFLVILSTLFLWLWFSNRRKYHNLKHAIPATIVKSYLDSIIQNSTALKSQLFRGGGLEINGVPSVMPLSNLMGGESMGVSGAPSTALLEELNQKKALIAALEVQLSTANNSQRELETKLNNSLANLSTAEKRIKELEALLAHSNGDAGGDAAFKNELMMVIKERDELRERLKEFEIISDDLANLKRLQQENEQLKRSLTGQGSKPKEEINPLADPNNILSQADVSDLLEDLGRTGENSVTDANVLEDLTSGSEEAAESLSEQPSSEDLLEAFDAEPPAEENEKSKSDKTPEDLLSEFEKMLG